jgi:hypothetical protein
MKIKMQVGKRNEKNACCGRNERRGQTEVRYYIEKT